MAESFARLGITLVEARVLRDDPPVLADVINDCRRRCTYVFTTGGIGPTHDDVTAESVALAFGVELVEDEDALRRISRGSRELNTARRKMAMIPAGASLIENSISHAPGFRMDNVYVLAGIPSIARAMFAAVEPELEGGAPILSDSVDVYAREGDFAAVLDRIAARFPEIEIGSYPFQRDGRYGASLVVRGTDETMIADAIAAIRAAIRGHD